MQLFISSITKFIRANGGTIAPYPTADLPPEVTALRLHLMIEELGEISRAMNEKDKVKLADGLGDMLYVVLGTAIQAGMGNLISAVLAEICRSNLTKDLGARWPGDRGARKGPNYEPPRIAEILDDHRDDLRKILESGDA